MRPDVLEFDLTGEEPGEGVELRGALELRVRVRKTVGVHCVSAAGART